jgi:hypothetical protein
MIEYFLSRNLELYKCRDSLMNPKLCPDLLALQHRDENGRVKSRFDPYLFLHLTVCAGFHFCPD